MGEIRRTNLDDLLPEDAAENAVRWIDTSCMVVDCLTKRMDPRILLKLMSTGRLDLNPTIESQMRKLHKSKQRRRKRDATENDQYVEMDDWIEIPHQDAQTVSHG